MEEPRRKRQDYLSDNLARRISVQEEKHQKRYEKIVRKNRKIEKQDARAKGRINAGIDFFAALLLGAALAAIVYFGLSYLTLSSQITEMKKSVKKLETSYSDMRSENDQAYGAVDASVDIGHVYDVAVGELGMVFPDDSQVVEYKYREEGYVRQYSTITEE